MYRSRIRCAADLVAGPALLRTSRGARFRPRPTLLHLPGLRALPFWTLFQKGSLEDKSTASSSTIVAYQDPSVTRAVRHLENHWEAIALEYQKQSVDVESDYSTVPSSLQGSSEHTNQLHTGQWEWRSFMRKGKIEVGFTERFPITSNVLRDLGDDLFSGTPFGYSFFSTLGPKSHIHPHTAPMNLRLRVHLALIVPTINKTDDATSRQGDDDNQIPCGIRVGDEARSWELGKALVLDDAYEHTVWNHTNQQRVLLLVDLWHPDVSYVEREEIRDMFRHAQAQKWLS